MSRIIVEYNPPLSVRVQKVIRNEVSASMVSNDETSCQYDISMVAQKLDEVFEQGMEDFDVEQDLTLINKLIDVEKITRSLVYSAILSIDRRPLIGANNKIVIVGGKCFDIACNKNILEFLNVQHQLVY